MITIQGKEMPLIDAHAHIWQTFGGQRDGDTQIENLGYGKVRQGKDEFYLLTPENADLSNKVQVLEGYMDWHGVDKAVLIQNPCYGDQKDYVRRVLDERPGKFVGIGMIEPRDLVHLPGQIDDLIQHYGFKGVKMEIPDTPFIMDDPEHDILWRKVEENDALVLIDLGWWGDTEFYFDIDRFTNVVKRHPQMKTVLCHLGVCNLWDRSQKYPYPDLQKVLALFGINKDHLWMDTSAMSHFDDDYPFPRSQEIFQLVVRAVGTEKLMWGTDFPTLMTEITYEQALTMFTRHADYLTLADWENLLHGTAEKVYFGK